MTQTKLKDIPGDDWINQPDAGYTELPVIGTQTVTGAGDIPSLISLQAKITVMQVRIDELTTALNSIQKEPSV